MEAVYRLPKITGKKIHNSGNSSQLHPLSTITCLLPADFSRTINYENYTRCQLPIANCHLILLLLALLL